MGTLSPILKAKPGLLPVNVSEATNSPFPAVATSDTRLPADRAARREAREGEGQNVFRAPRV